MSLKRSLCVFKLISLRCCDRFRLLNHNRFVQTTAFSRHFNPRKHKVGGGGEGGGGGRVNKVHHGLGEKSE